VTSRIWGGLVALTAALLIATLGVSGSASAAPLQPEGIASISLPPTGAGVDISFPQCASGSHVDLPAGVPFAIVGVNGGVASNSNPCLASEYNSALLLSGATGQQPHAAVYVNTGNPALAASWWPSSDTTQSGTRVVNPNGPCTHEAGAACAYIYGYSMAQADYRRVHRTLLRFPSMWWLDVETTNTWQPDVVANSASLIGMVDYFESRGLQVGIYSTSYQWGKIAGATLPASHLAGLPSWLAGGSAIGAPADCEKSALTPGGRVALVQYVTNLDNDYACRSFPTSEATVSPSSASVVGTELIANPGSWSAGGTTDSGVAASGVAFSYQWNSDGIPIPGATTAAYLTTSTDVGSTVDVSITGLKPGFSATTVTSKGVPILAALTPAAVELTGTTTVGQTLTASTGPWAPASATLTYRWYRGERLVSSGTTANTYTLTAADADKVVTVTVTGTQTGYEPVVVSAMTEKIQR